MAAPRPNGNTRTGQDKEFTQVDLVHKTRETFTKNEKASEAREDALVGLDGHMDMTDHEQRMGRTMTSEELIKKLQMINPNFHAHVSKADNTKYGLYLPLWEQSTTGGFQKKLTHICGFENTGSLYGYPVMPEYSIMETMEETIPGESGDRNVQRFKAERRGWRTVVAMLLVKGLITSGDVQRVFGLTPSKDSKHWHELMMTPNELYIQKAAETIQ